MPEQSEPSGLERVFAEHAAVDAFDRERSLGPGELSPRARVQALIDAGSDSFLELGARTRSQRPEARESSYGDGVVTAFGEVGGRMTAVLADDPVAMAQSDGGVGKNKRIRTLMHASQGCLPVVYFAQAAPADLPAPEEGGLLGRYSDGPLIVPEVHFDDRSAPIVTILGGEVAPELQALALDSDVVLRTPGGAATPIPSDLNLPDDAGAIATAATLMRLIPTRDAAPLRRAADAPPRRAPPSPTRARRTWARRPSRKPSATAAASCPSPRTTRSRRGWPRSTATPSPTSWAAARSSPARSSRSSGAWWASGRASRCR